MEYIGIAALSIMAIHILYMAYYILIKKKKNDGIPHSDKKEEVKYTIKKKYDAGSDDYEYYIYKNGSCISCKNTIKKAKEVIERSINNTEKEGIVYSKTINK